MSMLFDDGWLQEPQFQGWLVKVTNDSRRSYCRVCAVVLRASKGDLISHVNTHLHMSNAKAAQESGVTTGPISVQIVSNDEDTGNEDYPEPVGEEEEITADLDEEYNKPMNVSKKNSKIYIKKYRPAWEEEEDFKDWLQAYPEDVQRGFCKACKAILRAHKHDLTCHARTTRHQKKMQEYKAEHGGEHLFQMIAEDVVTIPQTKIRLDESGSSVGEIEIDASSIFTASREDNRPRTIKMSKPNLGIKKEIPKPFSKKRVRINAADVVAAIDNNEFTGYELLQIVKKAVPKL